MARVPARALAACALAGLCASACGYGLAAGGALERLAAGRAVSVQGIANDTSEAEAGALATRELGRALAGRGATRGAASGLFVAGAVERLAFVPAAPGAPPQKTALWRAEARLRLELSEPGPDGRKVLARSTTSGQEEYLPGGDLEATEVSRRMAVSRLLRRLAVEGLDRLAP